MNRLRLFSIALMAFSVSGSYAQEYEVQLKVIEAEVNAWNRFASSVISLHKNILSHTPYRIEQKTDKYGGDYASDYRFLEESFFHKKNGNLLSRIRWHNKAKQEYHTIEVFIYDGAGRIQRDYSVAYLPNERNAPIQTLVNIHAHKDSLHAYRQFDANGELLFEKCVGSFMGRKVRLELEDYEVPENPFDVTGDYLACFSALPRSAGIYLNPLSDLRSQNESGTGLSDYAAETDIHKSLEQATTLLKLNPRDTTQLVRRGYALLMLRDFDGAIRDYSLAIKLNPALDEAYFGRGMAYGRNREFPEAIADLTIYLQRNPDSSIGYTKRGVRYIWMGKLDLAKQDLKKAVRIDPANAEANDDLGVIYAQEKSYRKAVAHFQSSIKHDPTYQKAYHNLAMVYHLTGDHTNALDAIDKALNLDSQNRNSTMLKSAILATLGKMDEAASLAESAKMMDDANWSEQMTPAN